MNPNETWPLVDVNDDGIRPAGRQDMCFYCGRRIGEAHGVDCVIVTKRIEMRVTARRPDGTTLPEISGLWQYNEPHSFDAKLSEFTKNEGTWCGSNFLRERDGDSVVWDDGVERPWERLEALKDSGLYGAGCCLCGVLHFTFVRVVDATPRRKLRVRTHGRPS